MNSAADPLAEFLTVCERAARAGGEKLVEMRHRVFVQEKSRRDLVTDADVASQRIIREIVQGAFPDHEFIGEEDELAPQCGTSWGPQDRANAGYRWIVDPLDGTANFVHGMANFAVSVALQRGTDVLVGVVFDPVANECFSAAQGRGAFVNGTPIRTSQCVALDQAMVASGFSAHVERNSPEITRFIDVLLTSQSVRRLGSAALNLSYVAAGRMDAYWATSVKAWDVAAGALILREAGGLISRLDGSPFRLDEPELVAAATSELLGELISVFGKFKGDRSCPL